MAVCKHPGCKDPGTEYVVISGSDSKDHVVELCPAHIAPMRTGMLQGLSIGEPEVVDLMRIAFDEYLDSLHTSTWMIWDIHGLERRDVAYAWWQKTRTEIDRRFELIVKEGRA